MLRDPKVIEHLNTQLTNELTAVNQYFGECRRYRLLVHIQSDVSDKPLQDPGTGH